MLSAFGRGQDGDGLFIRYLLPPIFSEDEGSRRLGGKTVKLLVEGSRRFRAPKGLGLMPFEGATIAVFEHDLDDGLGQLLHEGATQTETIVGRRVSLFPIRLERDDWMIYVTQARPNVLIVATHRGYLVDLLGRMAKQEGSRALPDTLPEWKQLDPTARVWGVRHDDTKDAEFDPTSPLGDWGVRDDQAVGFVFAYDPQKHESIVRHLSRSKDATSAYSKFWQLKTRPEVREAGPGLLEFSTAVEPSQFRPGEADMLFRLSVALGHGLCL